MKKLFLIVLLFAVMAMFSYKAFCHSKINKCETLEDGGFNYYAATQYDYIDYSNFELATLQTLNAEIEKIRLNNVVKIANVSEIKAPREDLAKMLDFSGVVVNRHCTNDGRIFYFVFVKIKDEIGCFVYRSFEELNNGK